MTTQVKRGKLGYEDVEFGLGTFQRYGPSGALEVKTQIRASHIPILDILALYEATEIEAALAEIRGVIDGIFYPEVMQRVETVCTAPWEVEYTGVGLLHENIKDVIVTLNTAVALLDAHKARHIRGGADELDGDLIDIDYAESTYTPATTGVASHVDHLAAHLEGIDDFLALLDTFIASRNLTNHGVLLGSGTGPITPVAVMTNGQLLVGDTGADPVPKTMTGEGSLTVGGVFSLTTSLRIKGWACLDTQGAFALRDSFNVSGITDNGVGNPTFTWDTDFANTDYVVVGIAEKDQGVDFQDLQLADGGKATTSATFMNDYHTIGAKDSENIMIIAVGEQ